MKEATILLRLTKDQEVVKNHVTPIEAMLLAAEHHKNSGGSPIEVMKDTVVDIVVDGKDKDGKPTKRSRTTDEELDRLRTKYAAVKVDAILTKVKDMPETYEAALERGMKFVMPSQSLTTHKLL